MRFYNHNGKFAASVSELKAPEYTFIGETKTAQEIVQIVINKFVTEGSELQKTFKRIHKQALRGKQNTAEALMRHLTPVEQESFNQILGVLERFKNTGGKPVCTRKECKKVTMVKINYNIAEVIEYFSNDLLLADKPLHQEKVLVKEKAVVKDNGKLIETISYVDRGMKRSQGFKCISDMEIQYDPKLFKMFKKQIIDSAVKTLEEKDADYGVDYRTAVSNTYAKMLGHNSWYLGEVYADQRGRVYTKKGNASPFSPVVNKWLRAIQVIPEKQRKVLDANAKTWVAQAAATLYGIKKAPSLEWVIQRGFEILEEPCTLKPQDFEELWLNRLKMEWAKVKANPDYLWSVPIEIDHSASVQGYTGALCNDKGTLRRTNTILCEDENHKEGELDDAWTIPGVNRDEAKTLQTVLYGGGMILHKRLAKMGSEDPHGKKDKALRKKLTKDLIKEYWYSRVGHSAKISSPNIHLDFGGGDSFDVCFMSIDKTWDTESGRFKDADYAIVPTLVVDENGKWVVRHRRVVEAFKNDLSHIRTYVQTLGIHHEDSVTASFWAWYLGRKGEWFYTNHDAVVTGPWNGSVIERVLKHRLYRVNRDRIKIMKELFNKCGVPADKQNTFFESLSTEVISKEEFMKGHPVK